MHHINYMNVACVKLLMLFYFLANHHDRNQKTRFDKGDAIFSRTTEFLFNKRHLKLIGNPKQALPNAEKKYKNR